MRIPISEICPGSRITLPASSDADPARDVTVKTMLIHNDGIIIGYELRMPITQEGRVFTHGLAPMTEQSYGTWAPGQHEEESE